MKKKIRTGKVDDPSPPPPLDDLKLLVQQHSQFFDKLVELIPARFYLPVEDGKPWVQGLSKVARASAKKESRENIKKARRARLDPEKSSGTLDLLKKNFEEENEEEEEEEEEEMDVENEKPIQREGSLTYEELRERFHRKLEELRSGRKAGPFEESNRMKKRQINQEFRGKRKREIEVEGGKKQEVVNAAAKIEKDVFEAAEGLTFGHVKIGDEDEAGRKKKKLSKLQALEKAKKLEEAKKDPEKGEIVAEKHSWTAAASRAQGIKIHDDPKLIKQSIKKEKKKHEKNVGKWKDRIESRDKVRAEKQQKRSENISGRIQEKKKRKIEKREKKLMRPGFEGRKEEIRQTTSKVSNAVSQQQMKANKIPAEQVVKLPFERKINENVKVHITITGSQFKV